MKIKATFRDLLRKGLDDSTLLICLGGFAGPVKRRFIKKLYDFSGNIVTYYHWGDLDYGGLKIFNQLRTCLPELKPLMMDINTYETFVQFGEVFNDTYGRKLQSLLSRNDFICFYGG